MPYVTSPRAMFPTLTDADVPNLRADLAAAGIDVDAFEIVQSVSGNVWFGVRTPGRPGLNLLLDVELLDRMADVLDAAGWEIAAHHDGKRAASLDIVGRVPRVGQHITAPAGIAPAVEDRAAEVVSVHEETVVLRLANGQEEQVPIDAVAARLWDAEQVAVFLGIKASSARGQMSRWGVTARTYRRSNGGRPHALYASTDVRAAAANRPGRGARTDLQA